MNAAVLYQAAVGRQRMPRLSHVRDGREDAVYAGQANGVWWSTVGPHRVSAATPTALA